MFTISGRVFGSSGSVGSGSGDSGGGAVDLVGLFDVGYKLLGVGEEFGAGVTAEDESRSCLLMVTADRNPYSKNQT